MPPLTPPPTTTPPPKPFIKPPSPKQQSWGTIISIGIIVIMIVTGALYAWGKRVAEQKAVLEQARLQQEQASY